MNIAPLGNRTISRRRLLGLSLSYLMGVAITSVIIHEAAHAVAALSVGVPSGNIHLGFYGLNPSVYLQPNIDDVARETVIGYAGGLTVGLILSLVYVHSYLRFKEQPGHLNWMVGLITITIGLLQLTQGFVEGRLHASYLYCAGSVFNVLNIAFLLSIATAFLFHFLLCPLSSISPIYPDSSIRKHSTKSS